MQRCLKYLAGKFLFCMLKMGVSVILITSFLILQSDRCRLAHLGPKDLIKRHEEAEVLL